LVLIAVLALAYANSFPGAFFFDDDAAVLQNTSIRQWREVLWPPVEAGIGGRPFANITFALTYAVVGYGPAAYHATNLLIHAAAALVLFALARRTLLLPRIRPFLADGEITARLAGGSSQATGLALAIAAVWALHPLATNIVDYASQRTEGLMALLYLTTLYAYVRSTEERPTLWSTIAVVACLLGMATKEDMVTAPALVWLYDRTFISDGFVDALKRHGGRIAAIASTWILLAALMAMSRLSARGIGFGLSHNAFQYALTETRSIIRYLQLSLWPHSLVFDYGPIYVGWSHAWWSVALLLAALAGTLWSLWRWPIIGFAAAWFFITVSPSSSVIPIVEQPCAENRVYLPLVGVVALVALVGYRFARRHAIAALLVAAAALGMATYHRNPAFASELAVWSDTVFRRPENPRALNNLGNAWLKQDRFEQASPYFEWALELDPHYADARNNRGVVLLRRNRPAEALEEFKRAAEDKSKYADAYYNEGEAYLQLHRDADAVPVLRQSLEIAPDNPKAHNNLGIALLDLHQIPEAIAEERRAIALNPRLPEAHYNLGNALRDSGDRAGALQEFDATLAIDPRYSRAHNNAGVILLDEGRIAEAAARFKAALEIDPKYPEAKSNLALAERRLREQATAKQ
jgi:tetratricopeptide (TPR) repeat protein